MARDIILIIYIYQSPVYLPPNDDSDIIGSISPDSIKSTTDPEEETNKLANNIIGQITEDMITVPIRQLKFTDYETFLDIHPVPRIGTLTEGTNQSTQTINDRPICVVVGYPIAMRMPEQSISNPIGPNPDLESLMNMLS